MIVDGIESKYEVGQTLYQIDGKLYPVQPIDSMRIYTWYVVEQVNVIDRIFQWGKTLYYLISNPEFSHYPVEEEQIQRRFFLTRQDAEAECEKRNAELMACLRSWNKKGSEE